MDEAELIHDLKTGRAGAREEFYRLYRARLYATACHFLGYQDRDAEDLVQDAFVAAFESLPRFEGRSSLYTWLNHICMNLCFARIRKRKRQVALGDQAWEKAAGVASLEHGRAQEAVAQRMERLALVARLLEKLAEGCRQVMRLRLVDELDLAAIGRRLGVPMATAAQRISRCQRALKQLAEEARRQGHE
jgi:RNA polymerase sigma-70 factor (ECF subfamily)